MDQSNKFFVKILANVGKEIFDPGQLGLLSVRFGLKLDCLVILNCGFRVLNNWLPCFRLCVRVLRI